MNFISNLYSNKYTESLIQMANQVESSRVKLLEEEVSLVQHINVELDNRQPPNNYLFGVFDGQAVFHQIEEYDQSGQLIITEVIGYHQDNQEIWSYKND